MTARTVSSRYASPDPAGDAHLINRRSVELRDGLMNNTPAGRRAVFRSPNTPIVIAAWGDSRVEGVTADAAIGGGVDEWASTWPHQVARTVKSVLGLAPGGRGWLPINMVDAANKYRWTPSVVLAGSYSNALADTGVPGSQYVIPIGSGGHRIRVYTDPNATNVDFYTQAIGGGAYGVKFTTAKGVVTTPVPATSPRTAVTRIPNPGSYVDYESNGGAGFWVLGAMEYVGDELGGVRAFNFGVSGAASGEAAGATTKPGMVDLMNLFPPTIGIISNGGNDAAYGIAAATMSANQVTLRNFITGLGGFCLATTIAPAQGIGEAILTPYNDLIRTLVPATQLIDPYALGGGDYTNPAYFGWCGSDNLHFTQTGNNAHTKLASELIFGRMGNAGMMMPYATRDWVDRLIVAKSIYDQDYVHTAGNVARATGLGVAGSGARMSRPIRLTNISARGRTANSSGNLVIQVLKNGSATGMPVITVPQANQIAGVEVTGEWYLNKGDILTFQITAAGTTPGQGLTFEMIGYGAGTP